MRKKVFYTDGACSQNGTWAGGYGVVELSQDISQTIDGYIERYSIEFYKSETCEKTTNNREELKAIIEALKQINNYIEKGEQNTEYVIYTDSAYAQNILLLWGQNWAKNNWTKSNNQPILNLELIQEMYNLYIKNKNKITIQKVKGHSNILGNELADALAVRNEKKWNELINKYNILI